MNEFTLPPCNIRKQIIENYGIENACSENDTMIWQDCEAECKIASNCPECGHPRIVSADSCHGRLVLCHNPNCGMDK